MLFVLAALAAPRVDPGLEAEGVEAAYAEWAATQGREEAARKLVCRPFMPRAELCFTRVEGDRRLYFTEADGRAVDALELAGRGSANDSVKRLLPVTVEGFKQPYFLANEGDGRDHVPLLFPSAIAARVGTGAVVAVPARGVLVAWVPGDLLFDKVVAVGVRKMYETLEGPISPLIYQWDGQKWSPWGEAKAVDGVQGPSPIPTPSPVPRRDLGGG